MITEIFMVMFRSGSLSDDEWISSRIQTGFGTYAEAAAAIEKLLTECNAQDDIRIRGCYRVVRFAPEDLDAKRKNECPECHRQSCVMSHHGPYCADIRCKWGWEAPVPGDPSIDDSPSARFARNGIVDRNNPGRVWAKSKPGLPSLTSFQKLVLRSLDYIISTTIEAGPQGAGLLADIRRVVKRNE